MISPSFPEPLCDVVAQIMALRDQGHPKCAVWLATGTVVPYIEGSIVTVRNEGVLITADEVKKARFIDDPSDDALAEVLGYAEPKSAIRGVPVIVQARDPYGSVVLEMAASNERAQDALEIAARHGEVCILSMEAALMRRLALLRLGV